MPSVRVSPYLFLVLTNLFWAGNFVVGRAVHGMIPPAGLAFWRWALAWLVLAPFALAPVRRDWPMVRRQWPMLGLMGLLSVGAFSMLLYKGLTTTTATNALLLNSTAPVLIVLAGRLWTGERVTRLQGLGIAVSLLGVLVIVLRGRMSGLIDLEFGVGDVWVMAAVSVWAIYTTLLRRHPVAVDIRTFLAITIAAGLTATVPFYLLEIAAGATTTFTPLSAGGLLYISLFPSLLSHAFWNRGVAAVGGNRAGQFIHLTPVFGTALAILFLGESLRSYHVAGMALILTGILVATRRRR